MKMEPIYHIEMPKATWNYSLLFFVFCSMLMLAGCGEGHRQKELRKMLEEIDHQPVTAVEPLPVFVEPKKITYEASNAHNPFELPKSSTNSAFQPDVNRAKEELEAFPLDALHMVGTLMQQNKVWALISAQNGTIYRIGVGGYMGQNYGKVIAIDKDKITLEETVPDGMGGWKKRETTLEVSPGKAKE